MATRALRSKWLALICIVFFAAATLAYGHEEEFTTKPVAASGDVPAIVNEQKKKEGESGPYIRCRMCGAKIAKKADHIELHDTSKSIASRYSPEVGDHGGHIHTFVNPSRVEMELVAFKTAVGLEGEAYTNKATFFEGYNWRDFRCSSCNRHVGWKFHHDDLQTCIHTSMMETVSAQAEEELKAMTEAEHMKRKELVRKELQGKRITATAGWWSYELYYKKEVRQYHEDGDGSRPSDWSMGVFVGDDKRPGDTEPMLGTDVVQYFAGGQHCDENGELRNTKVVYTCCKSKPVSPTIDNIEEPSLCSYVITVCVPSLCSAKSTPEPKRDYSKLTEQCEAKFAETHTDPSVPASFAALRWSTVISEDSSELAWARNLELKT